MQPVERLLWWLLKLTKEPDMLNLFTRTNGDRDPWPPDADASLSAALDQRTAQLERCLMRLQATLHRDHLNLPQAQKLCRQARATLSLCVCIQQEIDRRRP